MGAQGAMKVLYKKELEEAEDPAALEQELRKAYSEKFASPYQAASNGMITDVIDPAVSRSNAGPRLPRHHGQTRNPSAQETRQHPALIDLMQFTPILAIAEKASTSVLDALPHLAGMLMVMATLTILWGVCAFTAKIIHIFAPEPKTAPVQAPIPAATPMIQTAKIPSALPQKHRPGNRRRHRRRCRHRHRPGPPHHLDQTYEHQLGKSWPPIRSHLTPHPLTTSPQWTISASPSKEKHMTSSSKKSAANPPLRPQHPSCAPPHRHPPAPQLPPPPRLQNPQQQAPVTRPARSPVSSKLSTPKSGPVVAEGDLVITLEAMKMYTPINAPMAGTITAIHVKVGDAVEEGQILYTIG